MKMFLALAVAFGFVAGIARADAALAPSALVAAASTYDTQTVTVTGTVKNVKTMNGPRGTLTRYQLCDAQCVNVVQFGDATVTEGQMQTVSGRFRASVSRGEMKMQNVIVTGMPGGGGMSAPSGTPSPHPLDRVTG